MPSGTKGAASVPEESPPAETTEAIASAGLFSMLAPCIVLLAGIAGAGHRDPIHVDDRSAGIACHPPHARHQWFAGGNWRFDPTLEDAIDVEPHGAAGIGQVAC